MPWWEETYSTDSEPQPLSPRLPHQPPLTPPRELPALLEFSRDAGARLDHVSSWRAVTTFAREHWLTDTPTLPVATATTDPAAAPDATNPATHLPLGEFFALRHAVADQLELVEEASQARQQWLEWAYESGIAAAIFHARSYVAFAEAEAYLNSHPGDVLTGPRPEDQEIPELVALTGDLVASQPTPDQAYQFLLAAAVAGSAATLARRADLAEQLTQWSLRWAPSRRGEDDRKLMAAQWAHGRGELREAARLAAEVVAAPQSEPVTTTIEARQFLAFLSLEAGAEAEAIRQLEPVVAAGMELDLTVAVLRSVRLLTALLNANQQFARAAEIAARALEHAAGMPLNPLVMDIQLILARSLLDIEDAAQALRWAEPVAQWSTFTEDEERTDAAFSIAATAAAMLDQPERAVQLLVEHGQHLSRRGDTKGAARALRQAARSQVHIEDGLAAAEDFMLQSRDLIDDGWDLADWHDDLAYIYYLTSRDDLVLGHVDSAAAGYLEAGDGEESARALLTAVRFLIDTDDAAGAAHYVERIEALLPRQQWEGHPVLEALDQLIAEDNL